MEGRREGIIKRIKSKIYRDVDEKKRVRCVSSQWKHHVKTTDSGYQCNYAYCTKQFDHRFASGSEYDLNDALGTLESHIAAHHVRIHLYYCSLCEEAVCFQDLLLHKQGCKAEIFHVFEILNCKIWDQRKKILQRQAHAEKDVMNIIKRHVHPNQKELYCLWQADLEAQSKNYCLHCDYRWKDQKDKVSHISMEHHQLDWHFCSSCLSAWSFTHDPQCQGVKLSIMRIMGGNQTSEVTIEYTRTGYPIGGNLEYRIGKKRDDEVKERKERKERKEQLDQDGDATEDTDEDLSLYLSTSEGEDEKADSGIECNRRLVISLSRLSVEKYTAVTVEPSNTPVPDTKTEQLDLEHPRSRRPPQWMVDFDTELDE